MMNRIIDKVVNCPCCIIREVKGKDTKPAASTDKRKVVSLIDPKRGQNAGIALARLKVPFSEVRER